MEDQVTACATAGIAVSSAKTAPSKAASVCDARSRSEWVLDMVLSSADRLGGDFPGFPGPKRSRPADESYLAKGLFLINEQNQKHSPIIPNCSRVTLHCNISAHDPADH